MYLPPDFRLEICVGMMCGSLPCIKPLYSRVRYGKLGDSAPESHQLSGRTKSAMGDNAIIFFAQDVEFSVTPAPLPRAESQDSILPRTLNYGRVDTQVHSVPR